MGLRRHYRPRTRRSTRLLSPFLQRGEESGVLLRRADGDAQVAGQERVLREVADDHAARFEPVVDGLRFGGLCQRVRRKFVTEG